MAKLVTIIPHFNNPNGLLKSVSSILIGDIIIVDDGSKFKFNEAEINACLKGKRESHFIYLSTNKGIEKALNSGIKYALIKKYEYIARLDCGDINVKNRLERQLKFLKKNKEVKLVGSWSEFYCVDGKFQFVVKPPALDKSIRKKMYFNSMFIHPTVMFKSEVIKEVGCYPYNYSRAEDYALFFNILEKYSCANIPEVLVHIENNPNGISLTNRRKQIASRIKVICRHFYFGYYPIIGLLRNLILFFVPHSFIGLLKNVFFR